MKTLLALLLIALRLHAEDTYKELRLTNNDVYRDVTVLDVCGKGLKITHRDGVGVIRMELLDEKVRKKYQTMVEDLAKADAEKKAADDAMRTKERAIGARAEAAEKAAAGAEMTVTAVKHGKSFFRYFIHLKNLSGKESNGTLSAHYVSEFAPRGTGDRTRKVKMAVDGDALGFIDWLTGPPCRHGEAGALKLEWTFKTLDGRSYSGSASVPDKITEELAASVEMVD